MSNLIASIFSYDRNEITVNDLTDAVNNAPLTMSSIGTDALYLNLAFCFGRRLTLPIEPTNGFVVALLDTIDTANDINIAICDELNGDELNANVFDYNGETFLVIFYVNEDESPAIKVFATEEFAE